jgi:hypothetical protein
MESLSLRILVLVGAVAAALVTAISTTAQAPQGPPEIGTLRSQARQLLLDSAFDISQHGVADSQYLTFEQPGPPLTRALGPYARVWPRTNNHRQDPADLPGRIMALIVSDAAYADLSLPAGSSYVYVERLDAEQACVQGQTANGQVRIVPADQRYDAQNTTLPAQPLCYQRNPETERGMFGLGRRRPHQNHRARAEWRAPNDGLWYACASYGCCYIGNGIQ